MHGESAHTSSLPMLTASQYPGKPYGPKVQYRGTSLRVEFIQQMYQKNSYKPYF